jgi:hypothetical protein
MTVGRRQGQGSLLGRGRRRPRTVNRHLGVAPEGVAGGDVRGAVVAFADGLKTLRGQIDELNTRMADQFEAHPHGPIFTSLPRVGVVPCPPRSETIAPGSPTQSRWPAWPVWHPPPGPWDTTAP